METQVRKKLSEAIHESALFGGFQFAHELELSFAKLAEILARILNTEVKSFPHPVGLVLGNVHHNATAILSLAPDSLLTEAYLVMRVLIDSAVTAGYLLVADEAERQNYIVGKTSIRHLKSGKPEELIQQATSFEDFDAVPSHRLRPLNERIVALCEGTGTSSDSWRVAVASIFPQSAEILTGTYDSYAFRLPKSRSRGNGEDFSMLFLMGSDVLHKLVGFCSKHVSIDQFKTEADVIHQQVIELMGKRDTGIPDPVQGAWDRLERIEHLGAHKISSHIADFETAIAASYEAGLVAPTLRGETQRGQFKHSALYFRRALNDLRATWVLLSRGYTAQAATCAGSLFESCLASTCLLRSENVRALEEKLKTERGNDFPWGAMKMAQMASAEGYDLSVPNPKYENSWRALYARYVWLSQMRHSTFQSVLHETQTSGLDCGDYVIMATPNCTEEDLPVKLGIGIGALLDIADATDSFIRALGYKKETGSKIFDDRKEKADLEIKELVGKMAMIKNPITIAKTKFLTRYPPIPDSEGTGQT